MDLNKDARDPPPVACSAAVVGGSGSFVAYRGCCGGGDGFEVAFVLWLRRCIDVYSGVAVEPRSLYRSCLGWLAAIVFVGVAGGWMRAASARGVRVLAAGFASLPLRRVEALNLGLGVDRGALPRPMCHSDRWLVSGEFFVRSSKLLVSEGVVPSLGPRCVVFPSSGGCFRGFGVGRRATACCAEDLVDFFVISIFSRVLCVNVWGQLAFQGLLLYAYVRVLYDYVF